MRKLIFITHLCIAVALGTPVAGQDASEIVVIAHPTTTETSLRELADIFSRRSRYWDDGSKAVAFNLSTTNPLRHIFDQVVIGLSPGRVSRYWIDARVRDGERPPRAVDDPKLVIRVVAQLPGAVGYVPADLPLEGVRVLARIRRGRLELEEGP